ncbi:hypothetical protein ACFC4S_33880 [Priestia megaterium]|uniref:hypothetical protein n=1 Tax=Priestia megaterium TaxID=1404 RepID=UPI001DE0EACF|nr:hypothetical protein [Priestia megaterium]
MAKSKLPKYFVMEVWEEIKTQLNIQDIGKYFKESDSGLIIDEVYNEAYVTTEIYEGSVITNEIEVKESLRTSKKRRNQTKKRWVQSAIKDFEKGTSKKVKELCKECESFIEQKHSMDANTKVTNQNPEKSIQDIIEDIKSWCEDTNSYLSNYRYILEKSHSQIKKALTADITVILGDILLTKYNGKIQNVIVEKPYSYVDNPVFSDSRGKLKLKENITKEGSVDFHYNDYELDSDYSMKTIVEPDIVKKGQVGKLDKTDEKIFTEILNYRGAPFATERKIYVDIGKVVRALFKSDNIENYTFVADRLLKMVSITFKVVTKKKYLAFGIFDYVNVEDKDGIWMAEITVNEQIYQEYLNKQTIRMYNSFIQKFELPLSRLLIFALQKERFTGKALHQNKRVYPYLFFLAKVRFKSRNRKNNYKQIEESLQEMVDNGICVKEFKRVGDSFYIEYIPITDYEVEDLLDSSQGVKEIINLPSPSQFLAAESETKTS